MSWMLGPLREGIMTILIVAGPIIISAAAVGLLIGILQAATQIQDQTIPSALKLIGVLVLLAVMGMWMFTYLTNFTQKTIGRAFTLAISNRNTIMPTSDKLASMSKAEASMQSDNIQRPKLPFSPIGNSGSFQATVAPPLQAFNNALGNSMPPMNYSSAPMTKDPNSVYMQPQSVSNMQATQQVPTNQQMSMQSFAQNSNPANSSQGTKKQFTSSKKTYASYNSSGDSNKVFLNSNSEVGSPMRIIRPVLPGSSGENYSSNSNPIGDTLPPPKTKGSSPTEATTNSSSDNSTAWW